MTDQIHKIYGEGADRTRVLEDLKKLTADTAKTHDVIVFDAPGHLFYDVTPLAEGAFVKFGIYLKEDVPKDGDMFLSPKLSGMLFDVTPDQGLEGCYTLTIVQHAPKENIGHDTRKVETPWSLPAFTKAAKPSSPLNLNNAFGSAAGTPGNGGRTLAQGRHVTRD